MDINFLKEHIKGLLDDERFCHSIGVMELAEELAQIYGADAEKAKIAGLIHDVAKNFLREEQLLLVKKAYEGRENDPIVFANKALWHGPAGAEYLKEKFDIDYEIYSAVFYHTIGKEDMTLLEKIVYLADCIEEGRDKEFDWAKDARDLARDDLDRAIIEVTDRSLKSIIDRGLIIHPGVVLLRNKILGRKNDGRKK